jgi:glucose-1-phosphate thymidylyltransferase
MNLIIPMAGMGKRMRPHTLLIPKPLLKIGGKAIVERIVEDIKESSGKRINEVHFIIGNFGKEVENNLKEIAERIGAKGIIHYQDEALGTAHAVYCAKDGLKGEILIAFADTLFVGDFIINNEDDAIIWTMEVSNPENYGVVTTDSSFHITGFVEKPKNLISRNAIIGIYYFKDGKKLERDIHLLIKNNFRTSGEFQLTDNLKNLMNGGVKFKCKEITEWLDCGNKTEFIKSNRRILELGRFDTSKIVSSGSHIIDNVYFGKNVELVNCTIGPNVSIGDNCKLNNCKIVNSIIFDNCSIQKSSLIDSMIGSNNNIYNCSGKVSFGDYVEYEGY